jgi:hypothetical protein
VTSDLPALRVALAVEGATDYAILETLIARLIDWRATTFSYLQPESSAAFELGGYAQGGWSFLYRWCRATAELNGPNGLEDNFLFLNHDVLVVQIDADVARSNYRAGHIEDPADDLPCAQPCPPVSDTTDALRKVVLRWLNTPHSPPRLVFCVPAQCLETWLLAGLYPTDRNLQFPDLECRPCPERQLANKPKPGRLINSNTKNRPVYQQRAGELPDQWPYVTRHCVEALRFEQDLISTTRGPSTPPSPT